MAARADPPIEPRRGAAKLRSPATPVSRVLLTGASGFIGRHCAARLAAAGFEVHLVSSQLRSGAWHRFDLLDATQCRLAVEKIRPTHLLHLAWLATPGVFWHSAENLRWLTGSVELARAFFAGGGKLAVGMGSCAEYQWADEDLAEGRSPVNPDSIYGRCKAAAGYAFGAAAAAHGARSVWLRLFYPYGPGEPADRLIPAVVSGLSQGKLVPCSDGTQLRDLIYVEDVADALVALLGSGLSGIYNLGGGKATSVREVVSLVASMIGRPDLVTFGARARQDNDPQRIVADISRLSGDLGWQPRVTLREGIRRTIEEHRANNH
jgi:nucleoside-diphosphate-sugar epimerase